MVIVSFFRLPFDHGHPLVIGTVLVAESLNQTPPMVLLTVSKQVNQLLGPSLLRSSLRLRSLLGRRPDQPLLDALLALPLAQKLVQVEIRDQIALIQETGRPDAKLSDAFFHREGEEPAVDEETPILVDEATLSQWRIQALEAHLRPVLVPNELWSDVLVWKYQPRFVQWLRTEYLAAKWGRRRWHKQFPWSQLTPGEAHSSLRLPTTAQVKKELGLSDWSEDKYRIAERAPMHAIADKLDGEVVEFYGGGLALAQIDEYASTKDLSLEDMLELVGGMVKHCGPLNAVCEEYGIYQLWTKEYVQKLCAYLRKRASSYVGETVILDVGSGDGFLAEALRQSMSAYTRRATAPQVVAVDNGSWKIAPRFPVLNMSAKKALDLYATGDRQVIVLCSWMPMGDDWSKLFRKHQVDEYILIGEADDGQCGDNWRTWGNPAYAPDPEGLETSPASYTLDGYERQLLSELIPHQFSRFDSTRSKNGQTTSFRRA